MTEGHELHQEALLAAFGDVMLAEQSISGTKASLEEITLQLKREIADQETVLADAWSRIAALLAETGEVEVILPGASNDYLIRWSTPRESVKGDPHAAPDEFVTIERKLKRKEIGEHLRKLKSANQPLPNWASLEAGAPTLSWKPIKRGSV